MREIIEALQYIHKKGYIHRDVKPENIFITKNTEGDAYACLGDFGIVKKIANDTESGAIVGSRKYLPLEVLLGEEGHSEKSDMYALGMSMYRIITGKHPYENFVEIKTKE